MLMFVIVYNIILKVFEVIKLSSTHAILYHVIGLIYMIWNISRLYLMVQKHYIDKKCFGIMCQQAYLESGSGSCCLMIGIIIEQHSATEKISKEVGRISWYSIYIVWPRYWLTILIPCVFECLVNVSYKRSLGNWEY